MKIVLMFVLMFFYISTASAATYYVTHDAAGAGDGLWATPWNITEGFATATAGDIVLVQGGTYTGVHPVIGNSGTSGNLITFRADNGTPVLDGEDDTGYGIYSANRDYYIIDGFELHDYLSGIYVSNAENVNVTNCTSYSNGENGFKSYIANYLNITNCTAYSNTHYGIIIQSESNAIIENCTLYSNTLHGLYLVTATDSVIQYNDIYSNSGRNIYSRTGSDDNLFLENDLYSPGINDYLFDLTSVDNIIRNPLNDTININMIDTLSSVIVENTDGQIFNETSSKTAYGYTNGNFSIELIGTAELVDLYLKDYNMGFLSTSVIIGNVPASGETYNVTVTSGESDWWMPTYGLTDRNYTTLYSINNTHIETQMGADGSANFTTNLSPETYFISSLSVDIEFRELDYSNVTANVLIDVTNKTAGLNTINLSHVGNLSSVYCFVYPNDTAVQACVECTGEGDTVWFNGSADRIEEDTDYYINETAISAYISFISPTLSNDSTTSNDYAEINTSVVSSDLTEFVWNWNGTNTTFFNDSTVLYLSFDHNSDIGDSSTVAVDVSDYGNDGSFFDGSTGNWTTDGKYNGAMSFDGVNDFIECSNHQSLNLTNFSISFWINTSESEQQRDLIIKSADGKRYMVRIWEGGTFVQIYDSATDAYRYSDTLINDSVWHHMVFNVDDNGNAMDIYTDTILTNSNGMERTIGDFNNSGDLYIAKGILSGGYANVTMDEIRIGPPQSRDEINQSYYSNLYKYNSTQWYFESNQTDLDNGEYNYQAFLNDNESEYRVVTVDVEFNSNITSWQNNKTDNNILDFTINVSEEVIFNATANQSGTWNWYNDSVDETNDFDNITLEWATTGLKHVVVNLNNSNGTSSNVTWNVTVESDTGSTPPASVTDLTSAKFNFYHYWTWDNPEDIDFSHTYIYINGVWAANQSVEYYQLATDPHNDSEISIKTVDTSYNMNTTWVNHSSTIPNNAILITGGSAAWLYEGSTVNVDFGSTDADGDTPTFSTNRTDFFADFNTATGVGTWTPVASYAGVYSIDFGVADGYSSTDNYTMSITVAEYTTTGISVSSTPGFGFMLSLITLFMVIFSIKQRKVD